MACHWHRSTPLARESLPRQGRMRIGNPRTVRRSGCTPAEPYPPHRTAEQIRSSQIGEIQKTAPLTNHIPVFRGSDSLLPLFSPVGIFLFRMRLAADWIDVKLGHAFDPHFVTKNAVHDRGPGMINWRPGEMIVGVCLFPRRPVFQLNHCSAAETAKAAVHPADNQIHFCLGSSRCCFLRCFLAIAL